jgi:hypothetical protein
MFHLLSDVCCKSVYLVLHIFHTYVASVLSGCYVYLQWFQVFLQVFQTHVLSVSSDFIHMLQVLHLDVSKVYRVLHLSPRLLLPRLSTPPRLLLPFILLRLRQGPVEGVPGDGSVDASACSPLLYYAGKVGIPLRCSITASNMRLDSHCGPRS